MIIDALKQNKKFILWLIIAVEIIIILPTLYGFLTTPEGYYYNGIHNLTPSDFHLYLSYFEQARQGSLFFKDLYTGEEQVPSLFNPFFLLFGLIGGLFNLSNIGVFLVAKIIVAPILIVALIIFLSYFFENKSSLRIAMIFAAFSSGLGFVLIPFVSFHEMPGGYIHWPMDLWVPEFNIFLTLYHNPLYGIAFTLILFIFIFFIKAINENRIKWSFLSGFCALLLFSIHPYHIPTIYSISALFVIALMIKERKIIFHYLKHWSVLFLISAPVMFYQVILVFTDFVMYNRYHGTGGPLTVPWLTLFSYGFLLLFAMPSAFNFIIKFISKEAGHIEKKERYLIFLILWFVGGMLLAYLPIFRHTRRLTLGFQIPLVVFTTMTLLSLKNMSWYERLSKKIDMKIVFILGFIILFGLSTVNAPISDLLLYSVKSSQIYIPTKIYEGMIWLKQNMNDNDVAVADSLLYSNFIPGIAGRHVYIGHNPETMFYDIKKRWLDEFFSKNRNEDLEKRFLIDNRISHIFYTKQFKGIAGWAPENKLYLLKAYENEKVKIFKVE